MKKLIFIGLAAMFMAACAGSNENLNNSSDKDTIMNYNNSRDTTMAPDTPYYRK